MADLIKRQETQPGTVFEDLASRKPPLPDGVERFLDFGYFYLLLLKRKWLILTVAITVATGFAVQVHTTTSVYTAVAKVQIDPEGSNLLPFEDVFSPSLYFLATESYIRTQAEILRSQTLARRVAERLNLAEDPVFNQPVSPGIFSVLLGKFSSQVRSLISLNGSSGPEEAEFFDVDVSRENAASAVRGATEIGAVRGTRLLEVSFTGPDPELAATLANVLVDEFIALTLDKRFSSAGAANTFLEEQMASSSSELKKAEDSLVAYAEANDIINIADKNLFSQELQKLTEDKAAAQSKLISLQARYENIKDATIANFPTQLRTPAISLLEDRLYRLEQEFAAINAQYAPKHPAWQTKNQELETIRSQLEFEQGRTLEQMNRDYTEAVKHLQLLEREVDYKKAQAGGIYTKSIEYKILQEEVAATRKIYQDLLNQSKRAGISAGLKPSNVNLLDAARAPSLASAPSRSRMVMLGVILGLMLGVGLALFMDYIDNTIKNPDDIEQFVGLPTLGVIPSLGVKGLRKRLVASSIEADRSELVARSLQSPRSQLWEAYRSLRTSILLSHSGHPPKVILVTSALPGEGKTTTALHTAMVLSQTGARTLLLDLDMRKPAMARALSADSSLGMSNYLSGNSDLSSQIQSVGVPDLFLLGAGPHPPNPAELLGSTRMSTALDLLRDYFTYIVVDSPPIISVTDALIVAGQVDGVLLVVHGGKTPRDAVRRASEQLHNVGARILGGMINNVDVRKSEYSYYYRYYYYSYEGYYAENESAKRTA